MAEELEGRDEDFDCLEASFLRGYESGDLKLFEMDEAVRFFFCIEREKETEDAVSLKGWSVWKDSRSIGKGWIGVNCCC